MACLLALTAGTPAVAADPSITSHEFGRLADGRVVHEFILESGAGLRVRLLDYGGIVRAIEVPNGNGGRINLAVTLETLAAHERRPNFSAIIGRYANRLSGGGVTIDGIFHPLAVNAAGMISHGGVGGFGAQLWQAKPLRMPGRAAVRLRLVSPAGENGFPGTLRTDLTFSVDRRKTLRLDYRAITNAPTVINLTHHLFVNLGGAGSGSVAGHWLRIPADRFTPLGASRLPTGAIAPVAGTPFDLRQWARIGEREQSTDPQMVLTRGFDHNFVLRRAGRRGRALPLAACVVDPASGRGLVVRTDQPGVQIYTAAGFDGSLKDPEGKALQRGAGLALETQHFADSPNHANFPSTVLRPGSVFRTATSFTFVGHAAAGGRPAMEACR